MRLLKILPIILVLCVVSVLPSSCASGSEPVLEGQVLAVQRGDLRIDITGVGNLALSNKVDLAFEIDGTVEEVLVEEGQSVEEGQVLAKLDTTAWEEQLTALEDKVVAAERNVTTKQRAVTDAERKVTDAEREVTAKELDLIQAQINLNNAQLALEKTEEESTDRLEIEVKELQVEIASARLEDAQQAVEDAATVGIEDAKVRLEDAQLEVEDAKKALEDAKKALDEVRNASPVVTAPFAGFITKVNVSGGDEVKKGTVAVTIADPDNFEADILVSEVDILQVKLGGEANVQVKVVGGLSLPAEVTHISPTATIQSGVVNYKVKVELQSIEALTQKQQAARQEVEPETTENTTSGEPTVSGELSDRLKQAVEEGRMTQEQAEEMMGRMGRMQPPQGGQQRQTPAMVSEDFQLKEGLTAIISITVDERNDVLLVPNSAITSQGRQTYVQVLSPDGTTQEQRAITAGINDSQYTEVIDGLSEGEQVIIPQGATAPTTAPTTPQQRQPTGGIPREMQRMLR